jgi:hypothetical protein
MPKVSCFMRVSRDKNVFAFYWLMQKKCKNLCKEMKKYAKKTVSDKKSVFILLPFVTLFASF